MSTETVRVSLAFARESDRQVEGAANTVLAKLFPVPAFAGPPVTKMELESANAAFTQSLAELVNGGKLATVRKNACRTTVVDSMKKLAYFVQLKCDNDMGLVLESGFSPVSTSRTRLPLPRPAIVRVENGMTGQAVLGTGANSNVRIWQAKYAHIAADGSYSEWTGAPPATDSRRILVDDLVPGHMVAFRLRAVGGSTGWSDWSDTVNHRAAGPWKPCRAFCFPR